MSTRTNVDLSKLLLVACDQAYFNYGALSKDNPLEPLADKTTIDPVYDNVHIYSDYPMFDWTSGYKVYATIERSEVGAKLVIYKNAANDVIVAFGGTDGLDAQDWVSNTQHVGWNQWLALSNTSKPDNLFAVLDTLKGDLGGEINNLHFTGQSLGGALAQYAAYEYVKSQTTPTVDNPHPSFDKSTVSLTTFNGLGAVWGLEANGGYDTSVLNGIGQSAHYVVDNDIVSRLGGGHIGSNNTVIQFDWTYQAGASAGKPMDVVDAHRIETAFYTHVVTGDEFAGGQSLNEGSGYPLIQAEDAVEWAGILGNLANNESVGPLEAVFRFVLGATGGILTADANAVDAVAQEFIKANYRAGKLGETTYQFLSSLNLGYVGKIALFNKVGGALLIGSFLGSLFVEGAEAVGSAIGSFFSTVGGWISSAFSGSPSLPTAEATSEEDAMAQLKTALAAEPDAFKGAADKAAAQAVKDKLGEVSATGDVSQAIAEGGEHWCLAGERALVDKIMEGAAYSAAAPEAQAAILVEATQGYESLALSAATDDETLLVALAEDIQTFWESDIGAAVARLSPDYLNPGDSDLHFTGLDTYTDKKSFTDALLAGLRSVAETILSAVSGTAQAAEIKRSFEQAVDEMELASEVIVLRPGVGPNPFDDENFDPEAAPVAAGALRESGAQSFSLYLPYAVGEDGLKVKLQLTGAAAASFDVYRNGSKLASGAGAFELSFEEGERSSSFLLIAVRDVDADETLGLSAQLLDAAGAPTHQSHLELNLAFDAEEEELLTPSHIMILRDDHPENDPKGETFGWGSSSIDVQGTDNDDEIHIGNYADRIASKGGDDYISAHGGDDEVIGGAGADVMGGGEGNDRLYGDTVLDIDAAMALADAATDAQGTIDQLQGWYGNDLLIGSASNIILGGGGADLIIGENGNDAIGGGESDDTYFKWYGVGQRGKRSTRKSQSPQHGDKSQSPGYGERNRRIGTSRPGACTGVPAPWPPAARAARCAVNRKKPRCDGSSARPASAASAPCGQ